MSELTIKCAVCELSLTAPATVFVPEDDPLLENAVCTRNCTNEYDKHREQQELDPTWVECELVLRGHSQPGCKMEKVVQKLKDPGSPLQIVINMPHSTPFDQLRQFAGDVVRVSFGVLELSFPEKTDPA